MAFNDIEQIKEQIASLADIVLSLLHRPVYILMYPKFLNSFM